MASAPCKNCDKKIPPDCHIHCEEYRQFREAKDAELKDRFAKQQATPNLDRIIKQSIWKYSRKKGV